MFASAQIGAIDGFILKAHHKKEMETVNELRNNIADYCCIAVSRCNSCLATQPRMGLWT